MIFIYYLYAFESTNIRETFRLSFYGGIITKFPDIDEIKFVSIGDHFLYIESNNYKKCYKVEMGLHEREIHKPGISDGVLPLEVKCNNEYLRNTIKQNIKKTYDKIAVFPGSGIYIDLTDIDEFKNSMILEPSSLETRFMEMTFPNRVYYNKKQKYFIEEQNTLPMDKEYYTLNSSISKNLFHFISSSVENFRSDFINEKEILVEKFPSNHFAIYYCNEDKCKFSTFEGDRSKLSELPYVINFSRVQEDSLSNPLLLLTLPISAFKDLTNCFQQAYAISTLIWYYTIQGNRD